MQRQGWDTEVNSEADFVGVAVCCAKSPSNTQYWILCGLDLQRDRDGLEYRHGESKQGKKKI